MKKVEDEIVFRSLRIILSLATPSLERYTLVTMEYLSEHALQYKGSDWAAMVFTFLSLYLLGNKSRTGFVMGIIANVFWFSYGYLTGSIANMFCSTVVIYLQPAVGSIGARIQTCFPPLRTRRTASPNNIPRS